MPSNIDYDVPPGHVLFEFGADLELVPSRFVPYLRKFQWQTFRMASGTTQILGKRSGLWYTLDEVLAQCASPLGYRFRSLSRLAVVMDRTSCWEWRGTLEFGAATCISRGRKVLVIQALYELMGLRWVTVTGHKCKNTKCARPAHYVVSGGLDER